MSGFTSGNLVRLGLSDQERADSCKDLVKRIASDNLETVRFLFVDQHGVLRGKSLVAEASGSALRDGVTAPSSLHLKDPSGRTVFPVWQDDAGFGRGVMTGAKDMLLVPDPSTYRNLPWSLHSAWVLCDVVQNDGKLIPFASRSALASSVNRLSDNNLELIVGLEVEFHIFRLHEESMTHDDGGMPGMAPNTFPLNHGYQLLGDHAYSEAEPILDELRRTASAMGLPVRSVEVEFGPSQFEFTFDPAPAIVHADNMVFFRTMAKQVCARRGLHATFMSRPDLPNCCASGWHIHQSLWDKSTEENVFKPSDGQLTDKAAGWIAGLLEHAAESCLLTTPTVNGYSRYKPGQLAPDRIQWGRDNRGAMLRALMRPDDHASRVENRIAEPGANPYYVFASQILSGLRGIKQGFKPPKAVEMPYDSSAERLPENLGAAIEKFDKSTLYRDVLGDDFLYFYTLLKRAEWDRYNEGPEDWEQREYFRFL